tara:strand:+ start:2872 stop:3411 length:540 start_codon:yes stop_codon:yes gene_type:complete
MKLKTIKIQGKDYVEVHERLKYFRNTYKDFSLVTEVVEKTETSILLKAIITNEVGKVIATGLAEEIKGVGFINKTSHIENCETSAWGRALANFGIGIDSGIASVQEVRNAKDKQQDLNTKPVPKPKPKSKEKRDIDIPMFLKWIASLSVEDKNMDFILKYLDENHYNYTKKQVTSLIKS